MRLRLPDRKPFDYQTRRDNFIWPDHVLRLQLTGGLISWFSPDTVIDPACGDGSVVASAHRARPIAGARLADISRPNFYYVGTEMRTMLPEQLRVSCQPIEETLAESDRYDVVVLTEILEHVEDPVGILRMARERASILVASSPMFPDETRLDDNPEHLWQFDMTGYNEMLREGGWDPYVCVPATFTQGWYDFQIWGAR